MSALVNALIAGRYQRLLRGALWGALYAVLLAIGFGFIHWQVASHIGRDQSAELGRISAIRGDAVDALHMLQQDATAPACSRDFLAQMQRVAFLPDGLNEFLYAPAGAVECSTSQPKFDTPVPLGAPDIVGTTSKDPSLRLDRDLGPLGRPGTIGTIAALGAFAVAIPPYSRDEDELPWLHKQLVALGRQGKVWDIAGDRGLYERLAGAPKPTLLSHPATVTATACDDKRLYCVASKADLFAWARDWYPILLSVAVLAALFAWVCANNVVAWLNRYWSFELRFNRGLSEQSIVVAYQPILDLRSDAIVGCEVLARWRDVEGRSSRRIKFIESSPVATHGGVHANGGRSRLRRAQPADAARRTTTGQFQRLRLRFRQRVATGDLRQVPGRGGALQAGGRARRRSRHRFEEASRRSRSWRRRASKPTSTISAPDIRASSAWRRSPCTA